MIVVAPSQYMLTKSVSSIVVFMSIDINGSSVNGGDSLRGFISNYHHEYKPWGYIEDDSFPCVGAGSEYPIVLDLAFWYGRQVESIATDLEDMFQELSGSSIWEHSRAIRIDPIVLSEIFYHDELIFGLSNLLSSKIPDAFNGEEKNTIIRQFAYIHRLAMSLPRSPTRMGPKFSTYLLHGDARQSSSVLRNRIYEVLSRAETVAVERGSCGILSHIVRELSRDQAPPKIYIRDQAIPEFYGRVIGQEISRMLARIVEILSETSMDWLDAPVVIRLNMFLKAYRENLSYMEGLIQFDNHTSEHISSIWRRVFKRIEDMRTSNTPVAEIAHFADLYLQTYIFWYPKLGDKVDFCAQIRSLHDLIDSQTMKDSERTKWDLVNQAVYGHCPELERYDALRRNAARPVFRFFA